MSEEALEAIEVEQQEHEGRELDPEVAARRAAALTQVRKFGDPVLRTRARPVDLDQHPGQAQTAFLGGLVLVPRPVDLRVDQRGKGCVRLHAVHEHAV